MRGEAVRGVATAIARTLGWLLVAIPFTIGFAPIGLGILGVAEMIFNSVLLGLLIIGAAVVLHYLLGLLVIVLMLAIAAINSYLDRHPV